MVSVLFNRISSLSPRETQSTGLDTACPPQPLEPSNGDLALPSNRSTNRTPNPQHKILLNAAKCPKPQPELVPASQPDTLLSATLLATTGGLLDAVVYTLHGHVFASSMTGNVILLGIAAFSRTGRSPYATSFPSVPSASASLLRAISACCLSSTPRSLSSLAPSTGTPIRRSPLKSRQSPSLQRNGAGKLPRPRAPLVCRSILSFLTCRSRRCVLFQPPPSRQYYAPWIVAFSASRTDPVTSIFTCFGFASGFFASEIVSTPAS